MHYNLFYTNMSRYLLPTLYSYIRQYPSRICLGIRKWLLEQDFNEHITYVNAMNTSDKYELTLYRVCEANSGTGRLCYKGRTRLLHSGGASLRRPTSLTVAGLRLTAFPPAGRRSLASRPAFSSDKLKTQEKILLGF